MAAKKKGAPSDIMGFMDYYLVEKAPFQLPATIREWIVKYGPWITAVILILLLPVILVILGISAALLPFSGLTGAGVATGLGLTSIALLIQVALMIAALPGLFRRQKQGWTLLFYAEAFNLLHTLLSGNIINGVVSALIGFYILFQIRGLYR